MVQPTKKSNSVLTHSTDLATGLINLEVVGGGKLVFDAAAFAGKEAYGNLTENGKRAVLHGTIQRLSDRAAIGRDKTTGASATPAEKFAAIKALADHYANGGAWELAGGGLPPVNRAALYQAVARVRNVPAEKVEAAYRDKADDVLRTLLSIPAIAGEYIRISREGAPKNEAADIMLEELDKPLVLAEIAGLMGTSVDTVSSLFGNARLADLQAEVAKLKAKQPPAETEAPKDEKKNKGFKSGK